MTGNKILMHKNEKVLRCRFSDDEYLENIDEIFNKRLLPPGILAKTPESTIFEVQRWLLIRSLSTSRPDIAPFREFYGNQFFSTETSRSLFDCYWFATPKQKTNKLTILEDWDEINAFDNWDNKKDTLYLMLANPSYLNLRQKDSPNFAIPGTEQKLWYKLKDKLVLLHGSAQKEMTNFKLIKNKSILSDREYMILANKVFTVSFAQTNKNIEWIPFDNLYNSTFNISASRDQNIVDCCAIYKIPNWRFFFEGIFALDEYTTEPRELTDIGVLRDSETFEYISLAKI